MNNTPPEDRMENKAVQGDYDQRKPPVASGDWLAAGGWANRQPEKPSVNKVFIRYDQTRQTFEALHKAGSEKFGGAWLAANMAIAEHAQSRVDISDPAVKELLSLCALRCLMRLRTEGYLPNDKLRHGGENQ